MTRKQALAISQTGWAYRFVTFGQTIFYNRDGKALQTDTNKLVPATYLYREGWKPLPATHVHATALRSML